MSFNEELRRRIRQAAQNMDMDAEKRTLAGKAHNLTCSVLNEWNAVSAPRGGQFGLESFKADGLERNKSFDALRDADPAVLMRGLKEMGMSNRHIEQVSESVLSLFDGERNHRDVLTGGHQVKGAHASMSMVVGRTAAASLSRGDDVVGLEAFGDDINRLNTDDRLTMDLIIMRPWENIMDKALARVNDSSPVVTIKVPSPEAWDWAKTQEANSTSESRNGAGNTHRLRDLYRNPTPVNSAPKKIVPLDANDATDVLWNNTVTHYKTGKTAEILDLSRNTALFSHAVVDRTDLVADGAILDSVIISLVSGGTTEYFKLDTRAFELAIFTLSPSTKSSGQRQVILDCVLPINKDTKQWNGTASTIATQLTDAKIQASVRINATLNIMTGTLQASGTSDLALKQLADGTVIGSGTQTLFGGLTTSLVAFSIDAYFDEENQRKANLALWVQYYEQQFIVPRSRIYFTDYSLTQEIDENAVAMTSTVVALGNGRRGLDTVVNALNDIAVGQQYAIDNPEIVSVNSVNEQSFASSLVKPTVITATIDFDTEELNLMNESTRLVEIHGRFRARLLSMAAMLMAKSLMLNQYKGGERPVFKAWVHSTIADIVIGITDYHPELKDEASIASGADYSMELPNGYRLDVIKSNFDCLQQRIYIVPVIESDMASVLSAASIRDCGTVSTNYVPTMNGAVTRRFATTTREIVMMSNKVGMCIELKGLSTQLGAFGSAPLALNANYSQSLAV